MNLLDYMETQLGEILESPEMYAVSSDALEATVWVLSGLLALGHGLGSPRDRYVEFWKKETGNTPPCWSAMEMGALTDILKKWVSEESKRRSERSLENS